eukprot:NODE_16485_length_310_cov_1.287356_g15318_i0.p2 GENE.NODE_16485_length_310_cov_1.287356_g15318_i0~~NODE_16485_length_310_cov_1.287356_g15318_i0.p2  ORF type:complete len:66 (+),score=8.86 NODE_16485_length_310_cov_1.287356_g15318_i0:93-290(+)
MPLEAVSLQEASKPQNRPKAENLDYAADLHDPKIDKSIFGLDREAIEGFRELCSRKWPLVGHPDD